MTYSKMKSINRIKDNFGILRNMEVPHEAMEVNEEKAFWYGHPFRPFIDCWALALSSPDLSTASRQTGYRKNIGSQQKKAKCYLGTEPKVFLFSFSFQTYHNP